MNIHYRVTIQKIIEAVVTNNVGYDFHTERYHIEDSNGIIDKLVHPTANLTDHLEQLEKAHVFTEWCEYQKRFPLFARIEVYAIQLIL